jgi:hypothetical protein
VRASRFIFVEGLMGAGKSTLVERLVLSLTEAGIAAVPVWEGPTVEEPNQPLRLSPTLPHPFAPWEDLTVEQYVAESLRRWRRFVAARTTEEEVIVCDGLLVHGNMTDLMLMGAPCSALQAYVLDVVGVLEPFHPLAIYLRRPDVAEALRAIAEERGAAWQDYQVNWKVASPYGRAHGLRGYAGLVDLYVAYRTICDSIFRALPLPTLLVENRGDWHAIYRDVSDFLGVQISDTGVQTASEFRPQYP